MSKPLTYAEMKRKNKGGAKKRLRQLPPQEAPTHYTVDIMPHGKVRYIREDLAQQAADSGMQRMVATMERIAVAQETQSKFYEKYDKMMSPLVDTYMAEIAKAVEKMKSKHNGSPFS